MGQKAGTRLKPSPVAGEAGRYGLRVPDEWCSWNGLFGGALFGGMIAAAEETTGRPLNSMTVNFFRPVGREGQVALEVETLAASRSLGQARVRASEDGHSAASGTGIFGSTDVGFSAPDAPRPARPPDASPAREFHRADVGGLSRTLDVRVCGASAYSASLWIRCPLGQGAPLDAALLAAIADHPPYAVKLVKGAEWYGVTLDFSLRICADLTRIDGGDWIHVHVDFDAVSESIANATVRMWTEAGVHVGVASQCMRIRSFTR